MKKKTLLALAALLTFAYANSAFAYSTVATLTGDNHYALYTTNADGSNVTFIGRNEASRAGNPGLYNWSLPETFNFNMDENGGWLYIAGWSWDQIPAQDTAQAVLGQFTFLNDTVYTGSQNWTYAVPNPNILLNDGPSVPSTAQIASLITTGTWQPVTLTRDNGAQPWGTIPGISTNADWIWGTPGIEPGSVIGVTQVFRYHLPGNPIPEPTSVILFGAGLLGAFRMRKRA